MPLVEETNGKMKAGTTVEDKISWRSRSGWDDKRLESTVDRKREIAEGENCCE
jgi:hypothetical protein